MRRFRISSVMGSTWKSVVLDRRLETKVAWRRCKPVMKTGWIV
jgi:hypothetical protein